MSDNKTNRNLPNAIGNSKEIVKLDKHQEDIEGQNKFAKDMMSRKISFLAHLLPTSEQRIAIKLQGELLEQQGTASLERSRMNNEFFRQALKASYDLILKRGLEANQRELTETGTINKAALDSKIMRLTEDYFNEMETIEEEIFNTKSDNIRARRARMLYERMDEFEATVRLLMSQYQNINEGGV